MRLFLPSGARLNSGRPRAPQADQGRDAVNALLTASKRDSAAILKLADRPRYPAAARQLLKTIGAHRNPRHFRSRP